MPERPRSLPVLHGCGVVERPCPWTECRHHLSQGEDPRAFAARKDASASCTLDVADRRRGLSEIGALLGLGPARVQQIEVRALQKLAGSGALAAWRGHRAPGRSFPWQLVEDAVREMYPRLKSGPKRQEVTHGHG